MTAFKARMVCGAGFGEFLLLGVRVRFQGFKAALNPCQPQRVSVSSSAAQHGLLPVPGSLAALLHTESSSSMESCTKSVRVVGASP